MRLFTKLCEFTQHNSELTEGHRVFSISSATTLQISFSHKTLDQTRTLMWRISRPPPAPRPISKKHSQYKIIWHSLSNFWGFTREYATRQADLTSAISFPFRHFPAQNKYNGSRKPDAVNPSVSSKGHASLLDQPSVSAFIFRWVTSSFSIGGHWMSGFLLSLRLFFLRNKRRYEGENT